jgi:integrase
MEVTVLGTLLRWAVEDGKIGSNPLPNVKALPDDNAKEGRALSDDEVRRLLAASQQPFRDIWYAYLVTGMRKEELTSLTFRDIDWDLRDLIVRTRVAKTHRERRIPIDDGLWQILKRQEAGRAERQAGRGNTPRIQARIDARFTRDHVFVTHANTLLGHRSNLYHAFLRCCARAGIETRTVDAEGRVVEHVDLHSLRRTFATNLIVGGADPETVRQLLGHATLEMTMRIYTKIRSQTKRQALARLSYGSGALAPEHVVEYPTSVGNPVQVGHTMVTGTNERKAN